MMENHWLVLFLLFAIRLALAEPDAIKGEPTTKISLEVETEIVTTIKAVTEPVPVPPESESDETPAHHLSLLNAPSSIKTASSGQRVKNPESGSAFALPWQSVDVSSKGTESTSTTTTTTLSPRVQQFNEHIRNQYKPQNQQQQKPQVQQQQSQIQQQYQPQTQQQEQQQQQIQQQSQYRPQSQSQYRPQFQQQNRPYVQQQSQQQVQSQQQTQQEVQTQNRVQPAFQQQSQEKVQPTLQQQSQIQVQPSFAEQSQQKVQPTIQQTQQRIKPPTQQRIKPPTQQRIQPPTQQRIQPSTEQPIQRIQPPTQQSQQQVLPSFSQQQQSQPAFQQVQSQEQVQPQIQQQTRFQYHQQSQPQVQDKFPPEFPKESYHHAIEEQAPGSKQYKASGIKTAPEVQSVSLEEAGNEVDPKIKEPYQSQPSEEEKLKKADLALNEYFSDVLQNLSTKMKTGMDEPLGEVLDPVQLDDMQLQPLVAGQVFDVKMKKITVGGLSDFKVTQLESQLSDSRIKVGIHYPKLTANCLFNANGSLYEIFKVTGKGNATIIFNDVYARTVLYLTKDDGVLQVTSADQPYVDFKSAEILFLDEEAPEGSEPIKAESVATQLGPLYFWVLTANAVDKIDYPLALYFNKALQGFPLSDFLDGYVLRQRHLRIHVPHNPLPYAYVSSDIGQI